MNRYFVGFTKLARRAVSFVAVELERNVANRDHHASALPLNRMKGQRRRWNPAQVYRPHSSVGDRALDRLSEFAASSLLLHELRRTRSQIECKEELVAAPNAAFGLWQ